MKKNVFLNVVFCLVAWASNAQDSTQPKHRTYKTVIRTEDGKKSFGYLTSISDSALIISNHSSSFMGNAPTTGRLTTFNYDLIKQAKISRKAAVGRGALIGGLVGLSIGVISGFAAGDDPPCTRPAPDPYDIFGLNQLGYGLCEAFRTTASQKAFAGGVAGSFSGALVGIIVGALMHKTFIIGGDKQKLAAMKSKLIN